MDLSLIDKNKMHEKLQEETLEHIQFLQNYNVLKTKINNHIINVKKSLNYLCTSMQELSGTVSEIGNNELKLIDGLHKYEAILDKLKIDVKTNDQNLKSKLGRLDEEIKIWKDKISTKVIEVAHCENKTSVFNALQNLEEDMLKQIKHTYDKYDESSLILLEIKQETLNKICEIALEKENVNSMIFEEQQKHQHLKNKIQKAELQNVHLINENDESLKFMEKIEIEIGNLNKCISEVEEALNKISNDPKIEETSKLIDGYKIEFNVLIAEKKSLENELLETHSTLELAQDKLTELEQNSAETEEIALLVDKLNQLKTNKNLHQIQINNLCKDIEYLKAENHIQNQKLSEIPFNFNSSLNDLKIKELEETYKEIEILDKKKSELQQSNKLKQEQLNTLKENLINKDNNKNNLQKENMELLKEVKSLNFKIDNANKEIKRLEILQQFEKPKLPKPKTGNKIKRVLKPNPPKQATSFSFLDESDSSMEGERISYAAFMAKKRKLAQKKKDN